MMPHPLERLSRNARARRSDTPRGTTSSTTPAAVMRTATRLARRLVPHLRDRLLRLLGPQRQLRRKAVVGYPHATMITAHSPELIDIGANLTHESFARDLPEVLRRAHHAGVQRMVVTGTSVAATRAAIALHSQHPTTLFATSGLHPHHAGDLTRAVLDELRDLACEPGVVAVGECGLDYYRNFAPREAQLSAFRALLELAVATGKPVFLHQRDAHADFMSILREFRGALTDAVAHCFTGQANELEDYLELNLAIGITGWICDERRGQHLLPMMKSIPASRLMIETDAPYLLPRSLRPRPSDRRNEPAVSDRSGCNGGQCAGENRWNSWRPAARLLRRHFSGSANQRRTRNARRKPRRESRAAAAGCLAKWQRRWSASPRDSAPASSARPRNPPGGKFRLE